MRKIGVDILGDTRAGVEHLRRAASHVHRDRPLEALGTLRHLGLNATNDFGEGRSVFARGLVCFDWFTHDARVRARAARIAWPECGKARGTAARRVFASCAMRCSIIGKKREGFSGDLASH